MRKSALKSNFVATPWGIDFCGSMHSTIDAQLPQRGVGQGGAFFREQSALFLREKCH